MHQATNYQKTNRAMIAIIVGLVVVVGGLVLLTRPGGSSSPTQQVGGKSQLSAPEVFYDFGTISMAKGKVSKAFKIKNPTSNIITATKLYTSCMCTRASLIQGNRREGPFGMPSHGGIVPISIEIAPGGEATVEAVFDPAAHGPAGVGPISREVYVETSDGGKLTLGFKAQVTP